MICYRIKEEEREGRVIWAHSHKETLSRRKLWNEHWSGRVLCLCVFQSVWKNTGHLNTGTPRFIVLHFIALCQYCIFLQTEGLWQPYEQICRHHFPNSIGSLSTSVSRCDNSRASSNSPTKKIVTHWRLRWWSAFFVINYFEIKTYRSYFLAQCYCALNRLQYIV